MAIGPESIDKELRKIINLPEKCVWIEIRMAVDELVTVRCEYYAEEGTGETVTQTFNVVPVSD